MSGFDRIRPRGDQAPPAPLRPDPQGRHALFSSESRARALGAVTISCSSCGATTPVTMGHAARLALPSLHLPFLRKPHSSFMRCPGCNKRTWVRINVQV